MSPGRAADPRRGILLSALQAAYSLGPHSMCPRRGRRAAPPLRPRTGPRSRRGSRIAGCRPGERRTRLGRRCRRGSAVPMGCPGSESEVAAPVNPSRSWPSRKGSLVQEQPRRRWRGCENTLAATPHRAFGEGGCSRHGPSQLVRHGRPPVTQPQDVAAQQDKQNGRCESRTGQSVNRPPSSFSHRSAAQHAARVMPLLGAGSGRSFLRPRSASRITPAACPRLARAARTRRPPRVPCRRRCGRP